MKKAVSGLACALALSAGGAQAAEKSQWNHSVWGGPRALTRGIEYIADHVDKATGGNFTIRIHYGDAISPAKENLDGIKLGAFESANFCASYHPGKNPAMNALDLPFLPIGRFDLRTLPAFPAAQ